MTPADIPTTIYLTADPTIDGGASLAAWAESRRDADTGRAALKPTEAPQSRDPLAATDGLVWPVGAYWDGFRWVRWIDPMAATATTR